jgi:hypothetical protein
MTNSPVTAASTLMIVGAVLGLATNPRVTRELPASRNALAKPLVHGHSSSAYSISKASSKAPSRTSRYTAGCAASTRSLFS